MDAVPDGDWYCGGCATVSPSASASLKRTHSSKRTRSIEERGTASPSASAPHTVVCKNDADTISSRQKRPTLEAKETYYKVCRDAADTSSRRYSKAAAEEDSSLPNTSRRNLKKGWRFGPEVAGEGAEGVEGDGGGVEAGGGRRVCRVVGGEGGVRGGRGGKSLVGRGGRGRWRGREGGMVQLAADGGGGGRGVVMGEGRVDGEMEVCEGEGSEGEEGEGGVLDLVGEEEGGGLNEEGEAKQVCVTLHVCICNR